MIGLVAVLLSLQDAAAAGEEAIELTGGSIAFMLTAMIGVTALTTWCFLRVLRSGDLETEGAEPADAAAGGTSSRDGGR